MSSTPDLQEMVCKTKVSVKLMKLDLKNSEKLLKKDIKTKNTVKNTAAKKLLELAKRRLRQQERPSNADSPQKNIRKRRRRRKLKKNKKTNYRKHNKLECGIRGCESKVIHLKRHFMTCHGYSETRAKELVIKKRIDRRKCKTKSKLSYRPCPFMCGESVQRLDIHLNRVHNLPKHGSLYKKLIWIDKNAKSRERKSINSEKINLEKRENRNIEAPLPKFSPPIKIRGHTQESLLVGLEKYLQSLDGGKHAEDDARTICKRVEQAMNQIGVSSIFNQDRLRDFVMSLSYKIKPNTQTVYIYALRDFFKYAQHIGLGKEVTPKMIVIMQNWARSLRRDRKNRRSQQQGEDLSEMLNAKEMEDFFKSEHYKISVNLIRSFQMDVSEDMISKQEFEHIRNFIMTNLLIDNACRSGPIKTMTLGQFRGAIDINDDKCVVVPIHKTSSTYGAQKVIFYKKLYQLASVYVKDVLRRTSCSDDPDAPLFPAYNGLMLSSSESTKAVRGCWEKSGISTKKLTATNVRKSVVTMVMREDSNLSSALSKHMGHSTATQQSFYALNKGIADSQNVAQHIKRIRKKVSIAYY